MAVTFKDDLRFAYVVTAEDVQEIWRVLAGAGSVTAKTSCADKVVREFDSLDELFAFPNAESQAIQALEFRAYKTYRDERGWTRSHVDSCRVEFASDGVQVALSLADESKLFELKEALLRHAGDTRAWYSSIASINAYMQVIGWSILVFVVVTASRPVTPPIAGKSPQTVVGVTILIALLIVAVQVLARAVDAIHRRSFPVATFALGKGVARYEQAQQWRWIIIGLVLTSIVSGLFYIAPWAMPTP